MRSLRFLACPLLLASFAVLLPSVSRAFTLDFQFAQNADLEQGAAAGGNDLGTTTKSRTGNSTWQTTTSGAAQTSTNASVTGLNAVIEAGETLNVTAGEGHSAEYTATVGPDHEFFRVRRL